MSFFEKRICGEYKYHGKIFNVRLDRVELQNGKTAEREVFEHCGGVAVLARNDNGEYALVRQYRYCVQKEIYEIPAGKLDIKDEQHREGAARELREETGAEADSLIYLGSVYPSPGCMTEQLHIYFASGLTIGEQQPDEDELLCTEWFLSKCF